MKKVIFALVAFFAVHSFAWAGNGDKNKETKSSGIHWMTFDEAQAAMTKQPKKVLIDMYTDWCGWCKNMDKKTFSNPQLAAYINEHFYPVKFNAEAPEPVRFMGKMWTTEMGTKTNQLAMELSRGQLSYPTTIFMDEGFSGAQPVPGYLDVPTMETILHYIAEGHNKGTAAVAFPDFQKTYQPKWNVSVPVKDSTLEGTPVPAKH